MPDGRVTRVDTEAGRVHIIRRGRTCIAELGEVATSARVHGARVRYELRRVDGEDRAFAVRLRAGTRTNKRQRRFGDLVGAKRPGAKVRTATQEAYGIDVTTQPFRVVRAWLDALAAHDLDAAVSLCGPDAVINDDAGRHHGRRRVHAALERSGWLGADATGVDLHGVDQLIRVERGGDTAAVALARVDRGAIVELWLGADQWAVGVDQWAVGADQKAVGEVPVDVVTVGPVPDGVAEDAVARLRHLTETVAAGTRTGRIKLTQPSKPGIPASAQVSVEIGHRVVRTEAAAPGPAQAADEALSRLHNKLAHHHEPPRHRRSGDGTWRHGDTPPARPPYADRPVGEREIVRHKSYAPEELTVEEALWDLDLLDYDFHLFVELSTGLDHLIERRPDGTAVLHPVTAGLDVSRPAEVEAVDEDAPTLPVSEAIGILDGTGRPFVFFANAVTGRANVVYRRYDGHYGLITPPVDDDETVDRATNPADAPMNGST